MAGENEIVIEAKLDKSDAEKGVDDLFKKIADMKSQLNGSGQGADDLKDALDDATGSAGKISSILERLPALFGATGIAAATAAAAWDDIHHSLEKTVLEQEKATEAVNKYFDTIDKRNKGKGAKDSLGDLPFDEKTADAFRALGEGDMGFAARGTILGRAQRFGQRATDFFSGDDSREEALRRGRQIGQRQRDIDKNNEKETERRDFEVKAREHNWQQQQRERERQFREESQIDAREAKEKERLEVEAGRKQLEKADELRRLEEKTDKEKSREAQRESREGQLRGLDEQRDALRNKDKGFTATIESSAQAVFNRIQTGVASTKDREQEATRKKLEDLQKERIALQEKWRKEDHEARMQEQDELARKLKEMLGLA